MFAPSFMYDFLFFREENRLSYGIKFRAQNATENPETILRFTAPILGNSPCKRAENKAARIAAVLV